MFNSLFVASNNQEVVAIFSELSKSIEAIFKIRTILMSESISAMESTGKYRQYCF